MTGDITISAHRLRRIDGYFITLPPSGRSPLQFSEDLHFVVKYVSPEGWMTYSPFLSIQRGDTPTDKVQFHWSRNEAKSSS